MLICECLRRNLWCLIKLVRKLHGLGTCSWMWNLSILCCTSDYKESFDVWHVAWFLSWHLLCALWLSASLNNISHGCGSWLIWSKFLREDCVNWLKISSPFFWKRKTRWVGESLRPDGERQVSEVNDFMKAYNFIDWSRINRKLGFQNIKHSKALECASKAKKYRNFPSLCTRERVCQCVWVWMSLFYKKTCKSFFLSSQIYHSSFIVECSKRDYQSHGDSLAQCSSCNDAAGFHQSKYSSQWEIIWCKRNFDC